MNFAGLNILVVGDVMLDHYITGIANRVSPEAPVPVVSKKQAWTVPGGAANVARCLARLGCNSRLVGLIASDGAGETLLKEIGAEGIKSGLVLSTNRPTTCKTRVMSHGQQLLRVDEEIIRAPSLEERVALETAFDRLVEGCNAVVLSDYAKGVLLRDKSGRSLCEYVIKKCRQEGITVLVDPKGIDWERYYGADCITPNSMEFQQICQNVSRETFSASTPGRQMEAEKICNLFHLPRLLLTRGAKGMVLYEHGAKPFAIKAVMREVADVSGAGDTVIATLAAGVASGLSWERSAEIANAAAGVAVGKVGTSRVSLAELEAALKHDDGASPFCDMAELENRLREWRALGQKIVFTNGCFDLLHPGHISLLRQCASFGDRLVVGLNSDSSVRRLKGPDRPIQNERNRGLVLGAIREVDAVVLFEEDTPEKLIHAIRPDCLVKGADYKIENVVGADFVQSYGGQVRLASLVEGSSTTGLAKKIRQERACQH